MYIERGSVGVSLVMASSASPSNATGSRVVFLGRILQPSFHFGYKREPSSNKVELRLKNTTKNGKSFEPVAKTKAVPLLQHQTISRSDTDGLPSKRSDRFKLIAFHRNKAYGI